MFSEENSQLPGFELTSQRVRRLREVTNRATGATGFMYVCVVTHISRVWINRVRLPIVLVVSWTDKMITRYFPVPVRAREFGLSRRVQHSRVPSACSSPYSGNGTLTYLQKYKG